MTPCEVFPLFHQALSRIDYAINVHRFISQNDFMMLLLKPHDWVRGNMSVKISKHERLDQLFFLWQMGMKLYQPVAHDIQKSIENMIYEIYAENYRPHEIEQAFRYRHKYHQHSWRSFTQRQSQDVIQLIQKYHLNAKIQKRGQYIIKLSYVGKEHLGGWETEVSQEEVSLLMKIQSYLRGRLLKQPHRYQYLLKQLHSF